MSNPREDLFIVTSSTALAMALNLMGLLNTIVESLPEPELRTIRDAMEQSIHTADDLLFNFSISSDFDMLTVGEVSTNSGEELTSSTPSSSYAHARRNTTTFNPFAPPPSPIAGLTNRSDPLASPSLLNNRPNVVGKSSAYCKESIVSTNPTIAFNELNSVRRPASVRKKPVTTTCPTSCYDPTPAASTLPHLPSLAVPDDPLHPMRISSRPGVGRPDYRLHPEFVSLGIPGPYLHPPLSPSDPNPAMYYIITKGLYVGIFTNWNECSPWVNKVSGNSFCGMRAWSEAMNLYNSRLATGSCEVLS